MIFDDFDFSRINSSEFKEDSVREELILPLLQQLGYTAEQIVRSKSLQHPFLKIGSKKRAVTLVPDYLLKVGGSYAWVLDAKSPTENIRADTHIEQVYSYATHPEVRTKFFALCNGNEFIVFKQDSQEPQRPALYFQLRDIPGYWEQLTTLSSAIEF